MEVQQIKGKIYANRVGVRNAKGGSVIIKFEQLDLVVSKNNAAKLKELLISKGV